MSLEELLLSSTLQGILIRLSFNLAVLFVLIRLIYYRFVKREEYVFSFFLMGTIIFLLVSLLTTVNIQLGMALGLFAVFGILRFRTVNYTAKDMTYIFTIIGISVINSQAKIPPPILGGLVVNSIIILLAIILELFLKRNALTRVVVRYNKLKLLNPDLKAELLTDLTARTGLNVEKVKILRINIRKCRAELEVFFRDHSTS
jgi:hypothetical protein